MTEKELLDYRTRSQADEIARMAERKPFRKVLAGIEIIVLPNVYQGDLDSELMCEVMKVNPGDTVLDLCTGTGVIALKSALSGASKVVAVDLNPHAIENVRENKSQLSLDQIEILEGSLFEPVAGRKFDVITINPPYSNHKPANKTEICFWDEDNNVTKEFFRQYREYKNPEARVYFGWADFGDMKLLNKLAADNNINLKLIGKKKTRSDLATFLVYELN